MKIGFIGGTGDEGKGLALRFARAGHDCIIGSRSAEKAVAAVAELRDAGAPASISGTTNSEAVAAAEIVVLTTPYAAQAETLPPLAEALRGKLVISTVVPMAFEQGRARLLAVAQGSAAQQVQALLPQSAVAGAFQNLSAHKLLKGGPLDADVLVCADDAGAKQQVMDLAGQIEGVRAVDGGVLANAQLVEGITALLVSINRRYKTQAGIRIAGI